MAEEILVGKNDKKIFTFSVSDASKRGSIEGEVDVIREPKLSDNYSLLLHYPNQFEYVFNRTFAYPNTKPMPLGEKFMEDYYGISIRQFFETPVDRYKERIEKESQGDIYPYLLIGAYKKNKS